MQGSHYALISLTALDANRALGDCRQHLVPLEHRREVLRQLLRNKQLQQDMSRREPY